MPSSPLPLHSDLPGPERLLRHHGRLHRPPQGHHPEAVGERADERGRHQPRLPHQRLAAGGQVEDQGHRHGLRGRQGVNLWIER